jgi:hypothetical protein
MGARAAVEVVPLHDSLKALPFGNADDIHVLTFGKDIGFDRRPDLHVFSRLKFTKISKSRQLRLFEMPFTRLVDLAVRDFMERNLDGHVAISLGGFHLGDPARTSFKDGHGNDPATRH